MLRDRRVVIGVGVGAVVVAIVGFLLFRPDTLVVDKTADEEIDSGVQEAIDAAQAEESAPVTSAPNATETTFEASGAAVSSLPPSTTTAPPGPVVSATGEWFSIDHETSGSVAVVANGDSTSVVFDELQTDNGPDLFVYLSRAEATDGADYDADFVNLGSLKGNVGSQSYELPADVDPVEYNSVVIWCRRFSVAFGAAPLAPT